MVSTTVSPMPAVASTQKPSLRLSSCVQSFILMQRDYEALEDFHVTFHQSNLPWHTTAYTGAHWRTSFGNCLFCQHSRVYSRSGHIYKAWQTLRIIISCTRVKDSCSNILLFKAYHSTLFSHSLSLDYAFLAEYPRLCLVPHPYGLRWV